MKPGRFEDAVRRATEAAALSTCKKSQRGAALFYPGQESRGVMATGYNALVTGQCTGTLTCRAKCSKRCEHAEAAAIRVAATCSQQYWAGLHLLHVETVDGKLVASGPPSCWQCSRLIAQWRVGAVWLYHPEGWRQYDGGEFHRLTMAYLGLIE